MINIGTKLSCSKLLAHKPIIKPNKQKVMQVNNKKSNMKNGWEIFKETNKCAVASIIRPIVKDFVTAALINPISISAVEIGADKNSLIVPIYLGK